MKRAFLSLSIAIWVSAFLPAQAATVTVLDTTNAWQNVNLSQTISTSGGIWSAAPSIRQGHDVNDWRSPFDPSGATVVTPANWQTIDYFAVGTTSPNNPAILNFAQDQKSLTFLWGSVDTYNQLRFYLDGIEIAAVLSGSLPSAQIGVGAAFVSVTDLIFDQIRFISINQNAFEFSNLATSPVPLPPAVLLFGTVLLGWGYLTRRRARLTAA